jgi:hypothetical protein
MVKVLVAAGRRVSASVPCEKAERFADEAAVLTARCEPIEIAPDGKPGRRRARRLPVKTGTSLLATLGGSTIADRYPRTAVACQLPAWAIASHYC